MGETIRQVQQMRYDIARKFASSNRTVITIRSPLRRAARKMKREMEYMVITATGYRAGSCVGNEVQTSEQAVGNVQGERLLVGN